MRARGCYACSLEAQTGGVSLASYRSLGQEIRQLPARAGETRVVAIDGPAGSGKSSFADRVASVLSAPVLRTDDICAGWGGLRAVPARLVEWVLMPLATSRRPRYRRYDWEREAYGDWIELPKVETLIIEGVMSGSRAASPYLSMVIWVTAPEAIRLERGVQRDGEDYRQRWTEWMHDERELFERDGTLERVSVLVDGAPQLEHDPSISFVRLDGPIPHQRS